MIFLYFYRKGSPFWHMGYAHSDKDRIEQEASKHRGTLIWDTEARARMILH